MNADVFADWLRRQGHRVVRTESSYWYNAAPGVFQAFPYHWTIAPARAEIRTLMWKHHALAVRYSTPFDCHGGVASYHIILREPYSLDQLKAQARNGVKTGMSHFKIEPISFERLATEGWLLQQDTLDRQERLRSMTRQAWERLCRAAMNLDGFEAWAATSNGDLAAAVIIARLHSVYSVPYAMSHRRYLGEHVNNALFYCVSKELLGRADTESLFFTVQSLDAPANVDEFKFRMGFQHRLVRQRVEFNPLVQPFATPMLHNWSKGLLHRIPSSPMLAKAEGMLRFHLEGLKPLQEQAWPERLLPDRALHAPQPTVISKVKGVEVTTATPFDVMALADLHGACFSKQDHIPVQLGRPFIVAVYRWFISSPETFVLVARKGSRIVGFTTISDRPYNLPMLMACRKELLRGYLRHPHAIFNVEIFRRFGRIFMKPQSRLKSGKVAQIAFTGVDPDFQGQGIGKALKAASIQQCRERGAVAISTGVRRQNERARHLNEQSGFVEVPSLSSRRLVYLWMELSGKEVAP